MFESRHAADDDGDVDLNDRGDEHGKHVAHAVVGFLQDDAVISVDDATDTAADGTKFAISSPS